MKIQLQVAFLVLGVFCYFIPSTLAQEGVKESETSTSERFSFVALGDTAYNAPGDFPKYEALIDHINQIKPAFSIHVGDIWGIRDCGDTSHEQVMKFFMRYQQPVIYTPGDNEWADCDDEQFGGYDALERLAAIRKFYFSNAESLGSKPMPLTRQSDVSDFTEFVENARWEYGGVLFSTVHVVGSFNNSLPKSEALVVEYFHRNEANVAWIKEAFETAKNNGNKAIVLAIHAEMLKMWGHRIDSPPYRFIIETIKKGSEDFNGQILVVHGDHHQFIIDRPLVEYKGEEEPSLFTNITRLQVYGAPEIKAVRVTVDPATPWVFSFSPLYVEE